MEPIYTFNLDADQPIMLINAHIGYSSESGYGVMGDQFVKELLALDGLGKKAIQVWINSPGGDVMNGMNIYNAILKTKTPVDTYCTGIAASIAGVIFQAGRKRIMSDYGLLMYHNPEGGDARALNAVKDSIVTMISSRSGKPAEDVSKIMSRTSWINAQDALSSGLCDEVQNSADHNKKRRTPATAYAETVWQNEFEFLNQTFNPENPMKKLALSLGLPETASELEIQNAIKALKTKSETPAAEVKVDTDAINAQIQNSIKTGLEAMKTELTGAVTTVADKVIAIENAAKKTAAEEMVAVQEKRIGSPFTDEIRTEWVNKAMTDATGTEKLLAAIPANRSAVRIEVTNTLKAGELPTSAASLMAKTMNHIKANGYIS